MKNLLGFLSIFFILGVVMVATKPGEQECILQVRQAAGAGNLLASLGADILVNRYTIKVEDHVFYQTIYAVTGEKLGTGLFGTVVFNK